jgi:S-adenosylmethionine synthetase
VTEGQPDKMCDKIADTILDQILKDDPTARVSCDVCISGQLIVIMGEITTATQTPYDLIARQALREIGYTSAEDGIDPQYCTILTSFKKQSTDIAKGIEAGDQESLGAGDTCTVVGFACTDTPELIPAPIAFANSVCRQLAEVRKNGSVPYLLPDGKAQVTVEYRDGKPSRIGSIVILAQHRTNAEISALRQDLLDQVIRKALPEELLDKETKIYVNPGGPFVVGGPAADSGLSGRKVLSDMYGGMNRGGGGSMSGKDPSKIHRVGAYIARNVAKSLVAAGLATALEVRITYAIGIAQPIDIDVWSFGTSRINETELTAIISRKFDLRPGFNIQRFNLRQPIYSVTSCYGHFGRADVDLPWERIHRL